MNDKEKEINALIRLLDDRDTEVFLHVEEKLISYGSPIISVLEDSWEKSIDTMFQSRVENLIHKIQYQRIKLDLQLWKENNANDLLKGALIINKYQYPEADEEKIINQIESIKTEVWMQLIYEMSPLEKTQLINHVLYNVYGFSGNKTYHQDPQNSYIGQVLETKKGNQILLATIYSIIAQKLGLPIYGVNLPQHFVLAYLDEEQNSLFDAGILFYINAFNKGLVFSRKEIDSFLMQLNLKPLDQFYNPCNNIEILKRIIRNLISSYEKLGQEQKVIELGELLEMLNDSPAAN